MLGNVHFLAFSFHGHVRSVLMEAIKALLWELGLLIKNLVGTEGGA